MYLPQTYASLTTPTRGSLLIAMVVLLTMAVSIVGQTQLKHAQLEARMQTSQKIVEASVNMTYFYYNQFMNGKMSEADAKAAALTTISTMKYAGNNYIYVYDYNHVLLTNLVRPDLVGVNRKDAISKDGVYYVQAAVNLAKSGGGFYTYLWDAGGTTKTARPKISYAAGMENWKWAIGTGDYVDDVISNYWNGITFFMCFSAFCIALGSTLLTWVYTHR